MDFSEDLNLHVFRVFIRVCLVRKMSCLLDNARIGLYLPTVILRPTIISYSITHSLSFQAYNLPFLQILPTAALNSLSSSEIFSTWIPRTVCCYF